MAALLLAGLRSPEPSQTRSVCRPTITSPAIAALLTHSDIAVIGGGPAGAIVALALAQLDRKVILFEAAPFPRMHIGISLSAGVRDRKSVV